VRTCHSVILAMDADDADVTVPHPIPVSSFSRQRHYATQLLINIFIKKILKTLSTIRK